MRIAHVVSGYLPRETGGVQIHVRDLCRGLRARGHEVEVFTRVAGLDHPELSLSRGSWDGVPVTALTNNFADLTRFDLLYSHPAIDARFGEFLEVARPDLVHVHHLTCLSTSMIEVARRQGRPVVMTLHDHWMVCPRGQRIRPDDLQVCATLDRDRCLPCLNRLWPALLPLGAARPVLDRLLRREPSMDALRAWERHARRMIAMCQATIAPSDFHRDRFLEWGVDPESCFRVPHGLDRAPFAAAPSARTPPRHLGYIGAVIPSKGVHVLCEAFDRLDRSDLTLHVHGDAPDFHGDTGYVDRLAELVRPRLDVRFHGRYEHEELPALLAGLDLLVVPSLWWESFCLTAYEGALAGVPVIASRLGALAEAVDRGLAVGFRAGDVDDLVRALRLALADAPLRERMSRVATLVGDLETSVTRTEEVYRFASDRLGP